MIQFTQGDTALLNLTAEDGEGAPIDLTGAVFTTYIKGPNGVIASFPNDQHEANADQVTHKGEFTLALTTDNTTACGTGPGKEILTQIVLGGETIYFHGVGILTVLPPVPVQ